MNKALLASVILSASLLSSSVVAGKTASIGIKGVINPPACDITTANSTISIPYIHGSALQQDKYTTFEKINASVSVVCTGAATVSIKVRDDSGNTAESENTGQAASKLFSLGMRDNKQLGFYTIGLSAKKSSVDGKPASVAWTNSGAEWLESIGTSELMNNANISDTAYDISVYSERKAAKLKNYDLLITPWIAPMGESASADSLELNGSASFELVYM